MAIAVTYSFPDMQFPSHVNTYDCLLGSDDLHSIFCCFTVIFSALLALAGLLSSAKMEKPDLQPIASSKLKFSYVIVVP